MISPSGNHASNEISSSFAFSVVLLRCHYVSLRLQKKRVFALFSRGIVAELKFCGSLRACGGWTAIGATMLSELRRHHEARDRVLINYLVCYFFGLRNLAWPEPLLKIKLKSRLFMDSVLRTTVFAIIGSCGQPFFVISLGSF